jgi:hypothetical protein
MIIAKKTFPAFLIFWGLSHNCSCAQNSDANTENYPFIYATYSFQSPGGDLSKRFGVSSQIGGGAGYKSKSNWIIAAEAAYIFGSDLKENPIENLINSNNEITNMYGEPAQINMREAGMHLMITTGKIISINKQNPNSGIFIRGGLGLLQHKIYIENNGNNTPQILGEYRKGYDRLCNGLALSEFIGWQNFSNKGAYHFLIGFEFTQGFTKNRRTWDFATNSKMDESRFDQLYSIKAAWFIPIRQKQATGYFYY